MKKVLVAGAALMLAGGVYASAASAAAVEPGVKITGDARARLYYKSEEYKSSFGNVSGFDSTTDMDSRVRVNIAGTAAGGAYAKARIRLMENMMGDMDTDISGTGITSLSQNNIWADQAYLGVPFGEMFTLEVGKYRSTYGPLPTTYNLFYDDVNLSGARGIVKVGNIEINPFIEWMDESQNSNSGTVTATAQDAREDNDEIRWGGHIKAKINQDWTVGGMLGYQSDERAEAPKTVANPTGITANEGFFGSVYTSGKAGAFALVGELAITDSDLNGMNNWLEDSNSAPADAIGSEDTGFGGYVFPNYTIDKLNIGLNLGFTDGGFLPDRAFGFVMLGGTDNSVISAQRIGVTGDWMWAGLVAKYSFSESLKLTGNLVYADMDAWTKAGDGPGFTGANNSIALDNAFELSAVLQYTISKGMDVFFAAGYLDPSLEYVNVVGTPAALEDDSALGAYTRFELKF